MAKDDTILINNFNTGVAPNVADGFEAVVGCDIDTIPGTIFPNFSPTKISGATFTDTVIAMTSDYALDKDGVVASYTGTAIPATPDAYTAGLAEWKTFTFHIGITSINTYKAGVGWNTTWAGKTKEGSNDSASFWATDDKLYIASGPYLYSLQEVDGKTFNPADSTTFIATQRALDLPAWYNIVGISQIGGYLALIANANNYGALFLWDMVSPSYENPIFFNEIANQIIAYKGLLYINVGSLCTFYACNGTSLSEPYKFPISSLENSTNTPARYSFEFYPNAIEVIRGKIFFGLGQGTDAFEPAGIYSFDPQTTKFKCENIISTGSKVTLSIGAIRKSTGSSQYDYRYGFGDATGATSYGIDYVNGSARHTSYAPYFVTPFYTVGTHLTPRTFRSIQVGFRTPSNGTTYNVKIEYRTSKKYNTWTQLNITNLTSTNGITSYQFPFAVTARAIQFRISFSGNANTVAGLEEIRIN
jgi:hypothetical protein